MSLMYLQKPRGGHSVLSPPRRLSTKRQTLARPASTLFPVPAHGLEKLAEHAMIQRGFHWPYSRRYAAAHYHYGPGCGKALDVSQNGTLILGLRIAGLRSCASSTDPLQAHHDR